MKNFTQEKNVNFQVIQIGTFLFLYGYVFFFFIDLEQNRDIGGMDVIEGTDMNKNIFKIKIREKQKKQIHINNIKKKCDFFFYFKY